MKQIKHIIDGIEVVSLMGSDATVINRLSLDSRNISDGTLFFAVPGNTTDGHLYIEKAIKAGASAICCERLPDVRDPSVTYIVLKNVSGSMAMMAASFFGHPSQKLKLVGITGTNGKTTTATLLYKLMEGMGYKCGLISTIDYRSPEGVVPATHTTPDAIRLNEFFSGMVSSGTSHCFMEVSSHALKQERVSALTFSGGIFTNITHDHLDYHNNFDDYISAKKRLFDNLDEDAFALYNTDDRNGKVMVQNCPARLRTYSIRSMADYKCKVLELQRDGMLIRMEGVEFWTRYSGEFNAYNMLAVYGTARELGLPGQEVITTLSSLAPVPGRFEQVSSQNGRLGIVDYAHTPDALANVLAAIVKIKGRSGKIITVVGAGGDRDRKKRPEMARIAESMSDQLILTSDNPRTEDPEKILEDMVQGLDKNQLKKVLVISNRREAIKTAVNLAGGEDIILLAGKGHENYQEINGVKHPFDDKEILFELLNR